MKKLVRLLVILIIIYLAIQLCFRVFGKGHSLKYNIEVDDNKLLVTEKYYQRIKGIKNHFDFIIKTNKNTFNFSVYSLKRGTKIVEDIYYYKDSKYECILPIFEDDGIKTDFMCMNNSIIYPYHTIVNKDKKLDEYINTVDLYDVNVFNNNDSYKEKDNIKYYYKNNDKNIAVNNYKGLYLMNDEINNINLFDNDVYTQKILCNVDNIYVVANYNEKYDFNGFYFVDINDGSKRLVKTYEISFDSYIQGIIDSDIYIVDKSNKKQYILNIEDKKIYEIGSEYKGTQYYDGSEFIKKSMLETINNELKFKEKNIINKKNYDYIGNNETGYYVYFKKVNEGFDVYKSNKLNKNLMYLFHVSDYRSVKYVSDSIYLIEGNDIIVYNDLFGKRKVLTNSEFEFNNNLYYFVY